MRNLIYSFFILFLYSCQGYRGSTGLETLDHRNKKEMKRDTDSYIEYEHKKEEDTHCPPIFHEKQKHHKKKHSKSPFPT